MPRRVSFPFRLLAALLLSGHSFGALSENPTCGELVREFADDDLVFLEQILVPDNRTSALIYADRLDERAEHLSGRARSKLQAQAAAIRLAIRIELEPWRPPERARSLAGLMGAIFGSRRDPPPSDSRQAELIALREAAGWTTFYTQDRRPVVPHFQHGVPVRLQVTGSNLETSAETMDVLARPAIPDRRALVEAFPHAYFVGPDRGRSGQNYLAGTPLLLFGILKGHPGPLTYARARFVKAEGDLSESEIDFLMELLERLNFGGIHPTGVRVIAEVVGAIAYSQGRLSQAPDYLIDEIRRLSRLFENKADAQDLRMVLLSSNFQTEAMEHAVESLVATLLPGGVERARSVLAEVLLDVPPLFAMGRSPVEQRAVKRRLFLRTAERFEATGSAELAELLRSMSPPHPGH